MVEITTRPMNQAERDLLQRESRSLGMGFAIVLSFLALLGGGFLSALLRGIGQHFGPTHSLFAYWIGWAIAVILGAFAARAYFAGERHRTEEARLDLENSQVEEILVIDADVVEISIDALEEPALVFRLDERRLLLLQGNWLFNGETYGADSDRSLDDMDPEFFNGLRTPHSFPSSSFVVTRFPLSRQIAAIRVDGEYVAPRTLRVKYAEKHCSVLSDCEIFPGTLHSLEQSLADAHDAVRNET